MHHTVIVPNPTFNKNRRTTLHQSIKNVLEQHFHRQKWPSVEQIAFLSEAFQVEKKVLRVWFSNRRQKEKKNMSHGDTTLSLPTGERLERVSFTESIVTPFNETGNHKGMDFPLNLSAGQIIRNVQRFSLGIPNGKAQRRTVLMLGTRELIHKIFINQIINYIVNDKQDDQYQFQLVVEEGQQPSCISVYDIHHATGFHIPYSLRIVVTPYSGDWEDSGRLFRDQKVAKMFLDFTESQDGIKELDMICNLGIKCPGHHRQSFLSIFGKDVEKNINNWELTENFLSDNRPWKAVVRHFFSILATMQTVSLSLTHLFLNKRKSLEVMVDRLQHLITALLAKREEINKIKQEMKHFQEQIEMDIINSNSLLPDLSVRDVTAFFLIPPGPSNELKYVKKDGNHLSKDVNRMYQEAKIKWNEIEFKGKYLLELMHKDLLQNASALKVNFDQIWRCIQLLNRIALHGNSFLTQKVFELLLDAEEHFKQLCLQEKDLIKKLEN